MAKTIRARYNNEMIEDIVAEVGVLVASLTFGYVINEVHNYVVNEFCYGQDRILFNTYIYEIISHLAGSLYGNNYFASGDESLSNGGNSFTDLKTCPLQIEPICHNYCNFTVDSECLGYEN